MTERGEDKARARPRPFVRWAGSKRRLLPELLARIPPSWDRERDLYVEPFLGCGALFWELLPKRAILSDVSADLMNTWNVVRGDVGRLVELLEEHRAAYAEGLRDHYEAVRAEIPECRVRQAARTIFLNRTCFNGLYRLNREGRFNVPWGKRESLLVDAANLEECSICLNEREVELHDDGFLDLLNGLPTERGTEVFRGALVYLDPPYSPVPGKPSFTKYSAGGFGFADQMILAGLAGWMRDLGAHVILSQSADADLVRLYERLGFRCDLVMSRRIVGASAASRGEVSEYVVVSALRERQRTRKGL
jgi:DNA adenine methylase